MYDKVPKIPNFHCPIENLEVLSLQSISQLERILRSCVCFCLICTCIFHGVHIPRSFLVILSTARGSPVGKLVAYTVVVASSNPRNSKSVMPFVKPVLAPGDFALSLVMRRTMSRWPTAAAPRQASLGLDCTGAFPLAPSGRSQSPPKTSTRIGPLACTRMQLNGATRQYDPSTAETTKLPRSSSLPSRVWHPQPALDPSRSDPMGRRPGIEIIQKTGFTHTLGVVCVFV